MKFIPNIEGTTVNYIVPHTYKSLLLERNSKLSIECTEKSTNLFEVK
jgi:hypothetical protein